MKCDVQTGTLSFTDDIDWYKIVITTSTTITAELTMDSTADYDLYLCTTVEARSDGFGHNRPIESDVAHACDYSSGHNESLSYAASPGTYYLAVHCWSGSGNYNLTCSEPLIEKLFDHQYTGEISDPKIVEWYSFEITDTEIMYMIVEVETMIDIGICLCTSDKEREGDTYTEPSGDDEVECDKYASEGISQEIWVELDADTYYVGIFCNETGGYTLTSSIELTEHIPSGIPSYPSILLGIFMTFGIIFLLQKINRRK